MVCPLIMQKIEHNEKTNRCDQHREQHITCSRCSNKDSIPDKSGKTG